MDSSAAPGGAEGTTVLVIEDDDFVRKLIERVLALEGFRALSARNGREGVALFTAQRDSVRCVMLDATLPDLSGAEALRQLLAIRDDVPIVLATGRAADEVAALRAMSTRVTYLMKPFTPDTIVSSVRSAVGKAKAG